MSVGDWLALVGLLAVQGGGIVAFLLRIEHRLTRLEALAEGTRDRRNVSPIRARQ